VLGLLVIIVVIGVTLSVLLWVGTVYLQSYFYTEPSAGAYWQAPAAGAALALFLLVWCLLNVNTPHDPGQVLPYEPYDTLFRFSPVEDLDKEPANKIWAVRKGVKDPIPFERRRTGQNSYEYVDVVTKRQRWSFTGVEAILLEPHDKGEKIRFELDKKLLDDTGSSRYVSEQGWVMGESNLGQPSTFRTGRFLANLLLNLFHLALWFVCLWMLLHFQWSHALGLAVVLWLVMTLAFVPMLMSRCGEVARGGEPPTSPPAAWHGAVPLAAKLF
jgi:hypothetical protein